MAYIEIKNPKHVELLESSGVDAKDFKHAFICLKQAAEGYYHQTKKHKHFYTMLSSSEMMLDRYPAYKNMSPREKREWRTTKDLKTGDRGYICRYLLTELEKHCREICNQVVNPLFSLQINENRVDALDLAEDIDALLLLSSIPGCFNYIQKLGIYKKGVFNPLKRSYVNYIQSRALHVISEFLKANEQNLPLLKKTLLDEKHLDNFWQMEIAINDLCERADPHHDDPIGLRTINNLRSIYISFFNIAMSCLANREEAPLSFCQLLPVIPDNLDFRKDQLQADNAWKRYQDHHFLFMRMPREQKEKMTACLGSLHPSMRIVWIGCLGKQEIRALILPMVSQRGRFENMVTACHEVPESDSDNYPYAQRVWKILCEIYDKYFAGKALLSDDIEKIFRDSRADQAKKEEGKGDSNPEVDEQDLAFVRNLSFLVVDDSDKIRAMTIAVLRKEGITKISEALNGVDAWKIIETGTIDIVLCDWIMPEMSGIELVQKMMQIESLATGTAFLMLTTVNDRASIVEALTVGVRGYLIKPFTRKQLLSKVCFAAKWLQKEHHELKSKRIRPE